MSDDWKAWANRRTGRAGNPSTQPPQPQRQPQHHSPVMQTPPPGYAWVQNPQYGMVLMPLSALQAPTNIVAPTRQPQAFSPMTPPNFTTQRPVSGTKSTQTCLIVKPGDRDTYAEMLSSVPSLAEDSPYDAMDGNPSPETVAALQGVSEFETMRSSEPPKSFVGGKPIMAGSAPLASASRS